MSGCDLTFDAMGCEIRVLIGEPLPGSPTAADAAERVRVFTLGFDAALSRFKPDSQLTALNRDPRATVPASPLLRRAVGAGIWAARASGGLADPTLLGAIETAGYRRTRLGVVPASLSEALAAAPNRRAAAPAVDGAWRRFTIDDVAGTITRPPGAGFDTGGSGKGLAADMAAEMLRGYSRFVVDCAGDIRVGGFAAGLDPYAVHVTHPLDHETAAIVPVGAGGLATSGLDNRIWEEAGGFSHHLLDPSTGKPAWTGLIGATARGTTALQAETLSKTALLSGPSHGREILMAGGGLLFHDDGTVEAVGPIGAKPVGRRSARIRAAAGAA